jgi:hypothetical protein
MDSDIRLEHADPRHAGLRRGDFSDLGSDMDYSTVIPDSGFEIDLITQPPKWTWQRKARIGHIRC